MYLDKLDGRIDSTFFDVKSAEWREEQNRRLREIERHQYAEQSYMDEGIRFSNSPERSTAVRTSTTARKTPVAQFRSFELLLEGRQSGRSLTSTV